MTVTEQTITLDGYPLHQLALKPTQPPTGSFLFFHGHGDYIDRYPPVLEPLVERGYQGLLTDLPGHGRSPGPRGAVPSLVFIDRLFSASLKSLTPPFFLAGHSMGGLLALHFLLQNPNLFQAAWISSPLLDPMHQAPPRLAPFLPFLAKILPWFTLSTGVTAAACGDTPNDPRRGPNPNDPPLYHSRITLSWAAELAQLARNIRAQFLHLPTSVPILFTQGAQDPICPPAILKQHLQQLPPNQITLAEIPEALHEPFTGSSHAAFQKSLSSWLDERSHLIRTMDLARYPHE